MTNLPTPRSLSPLRLLRAATLFIGLALAPLAFAQGIVASGLNGLVRGTSGQPIAGAAVTATHVPTGTTYTAITRADGRYSFSGMVVGGPYTVTVAANGFKAAERTQVSTQLGSSVDLPFNLEAPTSDVVTLEKFTVKADSNELDGGATGAASILGSQRLAVVPTVKRSFADVARNNPFVSIRSTLASRDQPIISALGQNNRYNSIQVDGARINDQFGLNGSGLQSFGNPITLDTIEQFSVAVSPYDVSQSGFTGVSINAVTKSGTNEFRGSAYYYYTDQKYQGKHVFGSTSGTEPAIEQKTKGFTFGGPILKNKLFFFINYERFDSSTTDVTGLNPAGSAAGTADLATINTRLATINTLTATKYDFGSLTGVTAPVLQYDIKRLAKIDWNIVSGQRLSIRYNKTEGALADTARFKLGGSSGATLGSGSTSSGIATATFATNFSSNQFNQVREEEVWTGQLFSQWTPEFKTEVRYAQNEYSQATPTPITFPEIRIFGVSGVASSGATISNGALVLGTEQNRQGNFIAVKTKSYSATGEYLLNRITLSGGYDREQSDFANLFRGSSYGIFDYASPTAFANDTPAVFQRNYYVVGTPADDVSDFAINGLFGQAKWDVNSRLSATFGLRYDWFTAGDRPPLNPVFKSVFGFGNDGTVDGSDAVSPRLSFNLALDDARKLQLRGGLGHFVGRIPWVIASNSYGNSGIGRTGLITYLPTSASPTPTLASFLTNKFDIATTAFDPANPIAQATNATIVGPQLNLIRDKLDAPSVWRGNLAVDYKLPFLGSIASVEAIHTVADQSLFVRDINLKPRFVGSDGRQVFGADDLAVTSGSLATVANRLRPEFSNVYEVSNAGSAHSTFVAFTLSRPMKDRWSYTAAYTVGTASDSFVLGETVAGSQFGRNPVFNQNTPQIARSSFEIRNRVQASVTREFEFVKKWKTSVSLYYEGRSGNPYSLVYSGDANRDGVNGNDLAYIPNGVNDPVLDTIRTANPALAQSIADYAANNAAIAKYRGTVTPRNGFTSPWINRLDLQFKQTIPLYLRTAELEVFADFVNFGSWFSKRIFGYTEQLTGAGDNELFSTANFGNAAYDFTTRKLQMTGTSFVPPVSATPNNELSRWRIQFGARLRF